MKYQCGICKSETDKPEGWRTDDKREGYHEVVCSDCIAENTYFVADTTVLTDEGKS